jgi:hypothetical protein
LGESANSQLLNRYLHIQDNALGGTHHQWNPPDQATASALPVVANTDEILRALVAYDKDNVLQALVENISPAVMDQPGVLPSSIHPTSSVLPPLCTSFQPTIIPGILSDQPISPTAEVVEDKHRAVAP